MNARSDTTAPAAPAMDDMGGQAVALKHMLSFLTEDLERSLNEKRGKVEGELVTLRFQREGLDATLWLASEIWRRVVDLTEAVDAAGRARVAS